MGKSATRQFRGLHPRVRHLFLAGGPLFNHNPEEALDTGLYREQGPDGRTALASPIVPIPMRDHPPHASFDGIDRSLASGWCREDDPRDSFLGSLGELFHALVGIRSRSAALR